MGSKKRPFYRLIATDSRMPRDGRFIETLGFYNPIPTPAEVRVDEVLVFKWFERGAIPTTSARSILRHLGYMQKWELMKQGLSGDQLEARVEAIVAQQQKAAVQREANKKGLPSEKAKVKHAEEAKKAEEAGAKPAEAKEEAAPVAEESDAAAEETVESAPKETVAEEAPAPEETVAEEVPKAETAETATEETAAEGAPEDATEDKKD